MPLKLKSISPSRIKTYDMCKFKYYLTYHTDHTLKSNWGAAHGSLLHDILEHYSNSIDTDWTARLYRGYAGKLETKDRHGKAEVMESPLVWAKPKEYAEKKPYCDTCPYAAHQDGVCAISQAPLNNLPGCPRDLFDGSIAMLESTIARYGNIWDKMLKNADGVPIGTEYEFNIVVDGTNVPMIGIMDLVIEEDADTIHIIDYKTGVWTQTYDECREDIQVKMYSLAARREFLDDVNKRGYKYKNVILTFDYFTKSPITLAFTADEDKKTEQQVRRKIEEIQSTDWITRIVKSNSEFNERWAWKCRSLCDTDVCGKEWKGKFKTS